MRICAGDFRDSPNPKQAGEKSSSSLEKKPRNSTFQLTKEAAEKDEFLAAISHEIRNPMNGIIGIAESIKPDFLDRDNQRKLGLLRQCARHLASLLDDVLDFSRVQPEAFFAEKKPFNLLELMESVTALTAVDSEKRGIPIETAISPGVPLALIGDERRIRQILLNYVINALKYSHQGKISITVWRNKMSAEAMEIFFAVSDEGPGIPPAEQEKIFTRFRGSSPNPMRAISGAGLGLSLCKIFAEKMGGKVWLKSEAGQGSCFYFSAVFATIDSGSAQSSPATLPPTNFKNALIIDDEEYNRIALSSLIGELDIKTHTAATESEALSLAKSQEIDLVLIDYSIPGLNGPAIARAIRLLPSSSAQAFIVATTGFNTSDKRTECLAAGMNAFLTKPITLGQLRSALGSTSTHQLPPSQGYSYPIQPDPLFNLRVLASKKGSPFLKELELYFSEFETELRQLILALQTEDPGRMSYYAHLLYGRCSFINERDLELALRSIERSATLGNWDASRLTAGSVQEKTTALQRRLFSQLPIVQRE